MTALLSRLTRQLSAKHVKNAAGVAAGLLRKRGQMKGNKLTAEGKAKQARGAAGRAKDRAAKYSGRKSSDFKYNKRTNRATVK